MTASISKEMSPPTLRRMYYFFSYKKLKKCSFSLSIVVVDVVHIFHKINIIRYEDCRFVFIYDDVIEFMPIILHKLNIHSMYL